MKLYITVLATTLVAFSGSVLAEVMNGNQSGTTNTQGNGLAQGNNANNMGGFPNNWTPNSNNMPMPWNNGNGQGFSMPWNGGSAQGFTMPWGKGGNNNTQNYPMQMPQMPMTNYFSPQQVQDLMMQQQAQFRKQQQAQYQAFLKQIIAMQAQSKQATATPKIAAPVTAPTATPDVIAPVTAPATPKVAAPVTAPTATPDVIAPVTAPATIVPAVVPAPTATVIVPKAEVEEAPVSSK